MDTKKSEIEVTLLWLAPFSERLLAYLPIKRHALTGFETFPRGRDVEQNPQKMA